MRSPPYSPFNTPLLDSPLLRTRLGCVAVTGLLCLGIFLRVRNLDIPTGRSPDEANYTAQAQRLLREGGAGLRGIAEEYLRDPAARLAGPPTRAGYLWALAAAMWLTGHSDETAGVMLSAAASIGSLLLVALIGIRFFPPWATLFALLFFAVFPPELELARRAWSDALVGLLGLAVVYCAMEVTADTLQKTRRRFWQVAFILTGCLGTVVKEFGAVTFALCAAWVVGLLLWRGQRRDALLLTVAGMAGALASLLWLVHGVGGLGVLVDIVRDWRGAHVDNEYAIEFQSGPAAHLFRAFWALSPGACMALIPALVALAVAKREVLSRFQAFCQPEMRTPIRALAVFSILYLFIPLLLPNWLNLRYVNVVFAPLMLLGGLGLSVVILVIHARLSGTWRRVIVTALLILISYAALSDYRRFSKYFVSNGIGDLSVKLILDRADMYGAERVVKRNPTAEHYLDLCWRYEQNWRYKDSVGACENALKLRSDFAAAFDQLAVAHVYLEQWPEARAAARRALALDATLPRAKFNLARAQREIAAAGQQR